MSLDFDKAQDDYDARVPDEDRDWHFGADGERDADDGPVQDNGGCWDFDPEGGFMAGEMALVDNEPGTWPVSTFPGEQPGHVPGQLALNERIAEAARSHRCGRDEDITHG